MTTNQEDLPAETLADKLDPLRPFVKRTATVYFPLKNFFSTCLISSFVRTFEFVELAAKQEPERALFLMPALRGITEDIIYFRFLSRFPPQTRESVIGYIMGFALQEKLKWQDAFFRTFRPFQPVLQPKNVDKEEIAEHLRSFWRENGWPSLRNREVPPVRQLAEKSDPGLLEVVYDFIYRLTSDAVHFSPQILLRSGWGNLPIDTTFSSSHMGPYYLAVNQVYGSYLLCLYFEFFGEFLEPNQEEENAIAELRKYLLERPRWPEMVTFEEMNVPDPLAKYNIILRAALTLMMEEKSSIMAEDGFISGAKQILEDESQ